MKGYGIGVAVVLVIAVLIGSFRVGVLYERHQLTVDLVTVLESPISADAVYQHAVSGDKFSVSVLDGPLDFVVQCRREEIDRLVTKLAMQRLGLSDATVANELLLGRSSLKRWDDASDEEMSNAIRNSQAISSLSALKWTVAGMEVGDEGWIAPEEVYCDIGGLSCPLPWRIDSSEAYNRSRFFFVNPLAIVTDKPIQGATEAVKITRKVDGLYLELCLAKDAFMALWSFSFTMKKGMVQSTNVVVGPLY